MYMKENENETAWVIELGFYPGVLLGFRSYIEDRSCYTRIVFTIFRYSIKSI